MRIMIDEWEVDYSNLSNMMRLSAEEFGTILTNYRPCIGNTMKRFHHYINLIKSDKTEEDGVYSWTQDTLAARLR